MVLGRSIANSRVEAGLTQDRLGQEVGRGSITVSQWEAGIRSPSILDLVRIARACRKPISALMCALDSFVPPPVAKRELKPVVTLAKQRRPRRKK